MSEQATTEHQGSNNEKSPVMWVFIIISIIFTLTMGFLIVWPIIQRNDAVNKVEVVLKTPNDSLDVPEDRSATTAQIELLINELNRQSKDISNKYDLLIKSQETESDFFRLVSCIAAFVVALLGFLGYRTIKDIENKAASIAKGKAEAASRDYTKTHLEQTVEAQLKDIVGDSSAAKLIHQQIMNEINTNVINPLETRVKNLEEHTLRFERVEQEEQPTEGPFEFFNEDINKINEEGGVKDE